MDTKAEYALARRTARRQRRLDEYRCGLRPFAVAVWNLTKDHNVGSLVRTAHAAAATEVLLVGDRDWNVEAASTAELYTEIVFLDGAKALLEHLGRQRWSLVAVELAPASVSMFEADYPERPCFLLGAERGGVPQQLMEAAALTVEIPQWGLVGCLNVAAAGSIVIYDHLSKLHREGRLDRPGGGLAPPTGQAAAP